VKVIESQFGFWHSIRQQKKKAGEQRESKEFFREQQFGSY
jgi:hypothetical protein